MGCEVRAAQAVMGGVSHTGCYRNNGSNGVRAAQAIMGIMGVMGKVLLGKEERNINFAKGRSTTCN